MVEIKTTYVTPTPIKAFNAVPRFGHTSDIASIYSNETVDIAIATDYVRGTLFVAGFCLAAFILWIIALLITKLMGKRAGVASGNVLVEDLAFETPKKHTCLRLFMLSSSTIIVISGFVFLIAGARSVGQVFDDVNSGAAGLSDVASVIVNATDDVIQFGSDTEPLRENLVAKLATTQICSPEQGEIAAEFDNGSNILINVLTQLQDFSRNDLTDLRNTFEIEFNRFSDEMNGAFATGDEYAQPIFVAVPVVVFGLLLAIGSYLAWKGPFVKFYFLLQQWLVLPVFFIVLIIMALVLSVTGTALVVNSDLCLGGESRSPEGFVDDVLIRFGVSDDVLEASRYYIINGCQGEYDKKNQVEILVTELNEGLTGIADLRTLIETDASTIINICGTTQEVLDDLDGLFGQTFDAFSDFVSLAEKNVDVLECSRVNDIFVDFYHDALCTSGPYSLMWIFATMMAVYGLGMAVILLRGALYPSNVIGEAPENRGNEEYDSYRKGSDTDEASHHAKEERFVQNDNLVNAIADAEPDNEIASDNEQISYTEDNDGISYTEEKYHEERA